MNLEITRYWRRSIGGLVPFGAAVASTAFGGTLADFTAGAQSLGNNYYRTDWFGTYYDPPAPTDPSWIYSFEHGWIYLSEQAGDGWWIWDDSMGSYWYTFHGSGGYPQVYVENWESWTLYHLGSSPYRRFFDYTAEVYRYVETILGRVDDGPLGPAPLWWIEHSVVDLSKPVSNRSPLNQGQLKHVASAAKAYLDAKFDLSSGDWNAAYGNSELDIGANPFANGLMDPGSSPSNSAPVNLGQLKYIAKGFYNILATEALKNNGSVAVPYNIHKGLLLAGLEPTRINTGSIYPWDSFGFTASNYSPAVIGQLKFLFSFDPDYAFLYGDNYLDQLLTLTDDDSDLFNVWVEALAGAGSDASSGFDSSVDAAQWTAHTDLAQELDGVPFDLVIISPFGEAYSVDSPGLLLRTLSFRY